MNENQNDVIPFRRMVVYLEDPDSYEFCETSTKVSGVLLYNKSPVSFYCPAYRLAAALTRRITRLRPAWGSIAQKHTMMMGQSPEPMLLLHAAILNCG
jgi:hypothetical protein